MLSLVAVEMYCSSMVLDLQYDNFITATRDSAHYPATPFLANKGNEVFQAISSSRGVYCCVVALYSRV